MRVRWLDRVVDLARPLSCRSHAHDTHGEPQTFSAFASISRDAPEVRGAMASRSGQRRWGSEPACTPDSVPVGSRPAGGGHPSRPAVARRLQRSTRGSTGGPPSPCSTLLPMGFTEPPGSPRVLVRSYRTVSPLPVRGRSGDRSRHRRSVLCGTFLRVAPTGCYPAPCPVESGRSSDRCAEAPGTRPPGRLATTTIVALRRSSPHGNRPPALGAVTPGSRRASRGRWR
jgi:hypothetical protein